MHTKAAALAPGFTFKVPPWKHQGLALRRSWDRDAYALFMEQGTGKSKVVVDTAAMLYLAGRIDALVVVAPNGVQRGWIKEQIPKHMTESVSWLGTWWLNKPSKRHLAGMDALFEPRFRGLRVATFNYELLGTKTGAAALKKLVTTFRCLVVCDESHKIKNPKGQRVQVLYKLAKHMTYRRVLTGTPGNDPISVYGQFLFLDEGILGYSSLVTYRAHFAHLEEDNSRTVEYIMRNLVNKYGEDKAAHMRPQVVRRDPETGAPMYRNLDELQRLMAPHSYRVLKRECLDLPPKVYSRRYVELTPQQRSLYNDVRDEYIALYDQHLLTAPLAITRRMRMAQITGGFFSGDGSAAPVAIDGGNPKLASLLDTIAETQGKVVVWARFHPELELIAMELATEYGTNSVARYWGGVGSAKVRDAAKNAFTTDPRCRFFVAQQQAGGTGLDGLQVAATVLFYSNDESLITRLQAEDRAHRGGSEIHDKVTIVDIEAEDTLDRVLLDAFLNKKEVADAITGDDPRSWL